MKRLPLFEKKIIKNLMIKQCESIALDLSNYYSDEKEPGWMSGLAGISCFFFHFSRFSGIDKYKNMAYRSLERVVSAVEEGFSHLPFATGLAGIHWMFHYLGSQKFISSSEAKTFDRLNPAFEKFAITKFQSGEYDALHGALGVFLSSRILPVKGNRIRDGHYPDILIPMVKKELTRMAIDLDKEGITWETTNPIKGYKEINFGLAHGIPSILQNLSWLYKITKDNSILSTLIEPGMKFMLQHMNDEPDDQSCFPVRIKESRAQRPSRLAWCYGDPGIAHAIYEIGENCIRPEWQSIAVSVLKKGSSRLSQKDTGINDACICHGSAGLALMYYSVACKTGYEPFFETSRKWARTTLDFGNAENGFAGYLFKDNQNNYIPKYGFLEGISGVGLTLLALIEGELPGWEKGIML